MFALIKLSKCLYAKSVWIILGGDIRNISLFLSITPWCYKSEWEAHKEAQTLTSDKTRLKIRHFQALPTGAWAVAEATSPARQRQSPHRAALSIKHKTTLPSSWHIITQ